MKEDFNNNVNKIYCEKCDLIFNSRIKYEKHLDSHYSKVSCETCPIDTAIAKFMNIFKKNSSENLE